MYRISRNSNRRRIITAPVIVTAGQFLTKKMIIVTSVLLRLLLREIWYIYPIFGENLTNKMIGTAANITGNTVLNENDSSFWNQLNPQDLRLKNPLSYQSQENMRRVSDRADKACNFLNLFALSILGSVYVSWVGINLDDNTFCRAL